jgi:arylsulfatase A-like enzyme
LIIVGPGLNQRTIKEQVSLLNIPPTILSLVSEKDYPFFQGKSILSLMADGIGGEEYVISEGCERDPKSVLPRAVNERISCRSLSWKYIYNYNGADELYSLTKDPAETVNLVNDEVEISKKFKQKIQEHLEKEKTQVIKIKEARRIKAVFKSKGLQRLR